MGWQEEEKQEYQRGTEKLGKTVQFGTAALVEVHHQE
jgi:hypothetical protein